MTDSKMSYALEQGDFTRPATGRPVVYARNGVISSGHYLTSMAGMRILLDGGNAFDALVASTFAAAVVEPIASYSLGAESTFMFFDAKSGDFKALSGQGTAAGKATPNYFTSKGYDAIPTGPGNGAPLSFTVPGVVAACLSLLSKYGTKTVGDVLTPSIEYAESGIPNYEYMLERLKVGESLSQFKLFPPGGLEIFFCNGNIPEPGSILVQSALGGILRKMADAESSAGNDRQNGIAAARDCFYRGEIADLIGAASDRVGGILTKSDLAGYQEEYSQPVSTSYQGYTIHGQSTWTQAPVCLQALNILEQFDLRRLGHNTPGYIHTVTEALKLAFADREAFYGDPEFSSVPIDGLLSKEYAAARAKLINPQEAIPGLPEYGDPWRYSSIDGSITPQPDLVVGGFTDLQHESGTTHISVVDRAGNMVCSTPSGGAFNKSVFFPELGFTVSTRSEMFNLTEGHPNCVAPGKRPRTTIINFMVTLDNTPIMTIGCPGGDAQAQANLQLLLNIIIWGMNPQEAVESPRFSSLSVPNSFFPHVYLRGQLALEDGFAQSTREALERLGHHVVHSSTCGMGGTITKRNPHTGILATSSDPRRSCYAIGW